MAVKSQNIYEYNKVKSIEENEFYGLGCIESGQIRMLKNKINELVIEQNHLMKDFELYKKAFKSHCSEGLNDAHGISKQVYSLGPETNKRRNLAVQIVQHSSYY